MHLHAQPLASFPVFLSLHKAVYTHLPLDPSTTFSFYINISWGTNPFPPFCEMKVGRVKAWERQVLSFTLQGWQQPGAVFENTSQAVHNPGEKISSELLVTNIQYCRTELLRHRISQRLANACNKWTFKKMKIEYVYKRANCLTKSLSII